MVAEGEAARCPHCGEMNPPPYPPTAKMDTCQSCRQDYVIGSSDASVTVEPVPIDAMSRWIAWKTRIRTRPIPEKWKWLLLLVTFAPMVIGGLLFARPYFFQSYRWLDRLYLLTAVTAAWHLIVLVLWTVHIWFDDLLTRGERTLWWAVIWLGGYGGLAVYLYFRVWLDTPIGVSQVRSTRDVETEAEGDRG